MTKNEDYRQASKKLDGWVHLLLNESGLPDEGKPLMGCRLDSENKHIRRVMKENLQKTLRSRGNAPSE